MKSKLRLIGLLLLSVSVYAGTLTDTTSNIHTDVVGAAVNIASIVLVIGGFVAACTGRFAGLVSMLIGAIIALGADKIVPLLQGFVA